jgi:hypothetical protein
MKAFGSFAPLYIEPKRRLVSELEPKFKNSAVAVLDELAAHADEYGLCWPGIHRLATLCRYSPATIQQALDILGSYDYVHVHLDPLGVRPPAYQLSPWVLYIAEDQLDYALDLWNKSSYVKQILTLVEEPESLTRPITRKEPESRTKNITTTTTKTDSSNAEKASQEIDIQREAQESGNNARKDQKRQSPYHSAQSAKNSALSTDNLPSSSAKRNQPKSKDSAAARKSISDPLTDSLAEAVARRLSNWGNTPLVQARGYVATFGRDQVAEMMMAISGEKAVKNPIGLLVYRLENGIKPEKVERHELYGIK